MDEYESQINPEAAVSSTENQQSLRTLIEKINEQRRTGATLSEAVRSHGLSLLDYLTGCGTFGISFTGYDMHTTPADRAAFLEVYESLRAEGERSKTVAYRFGLTSQKLGEWVSRARGEIGHSKPKRGRPRGSVNKPATTQVFNVHYEDPTPAPQQDTSPEPERAQTSSQLAAVFFKGDKQGIEQLAQVLLTINKG